MEEERKKQAVQAKKRKERYRVVINSSFSQSKNYVLL